MPSERTECIETTDTRLHMHGPKVSGPSEQPRIRLHSLCGEELAARRNPFLLLQGRRPSDQTTSLLFQELCRPCTAGRQRQSLSFLGNFLARSCSQAGENSCHGKYRCSRFHQCLGKGDERVRLLGAQIPGIEILFGKPEPIEPIGILENIV